MFRVRVDKKTTLHHTSVGVLEFNSTQKFLISKSTSVVEDGLMAMIQYYSKAFPHNSPNSPIFIFLKIVIIIKTSSSELRGQEEAASIHIFRPMRTLH